MLNNLKIVAACVVGLGIVAGGAATLAQHVAGGRDDAPAVNDGQSKDDGNRLAQQEKKSHGPRELTNARPRTGEALHALLVEKRDYLRQFVESSRRSFPDREKSIWDLLRATPALLEVELKLADTPRDRLAILEKTLTEAKQLEEIINEMLAGHAVVSTVDVMNAKVFRLDVQIRFEEEKLREDAPTP
jgi:hypothetical protein